MISDGKFSVTCTDYFTVIVRHVLMAFWFLYLTVVISCAWQITQLNV